MILNSPLSINKIIYLLVSYFFFCEQVCAQKKVDLFYDSACVLSKENKIIEAYSMLDSAINNGYYKIGWMSVDADLHNMHMDANWNDFKKKSFDKSIALEPVKNLLLKKEILAIYEDDQKVRQYAVTNRNLSKDENEKLFQQIKSNEKITRNKVALIIDKYGWLSIADIGSEANETIALVLIHCDSLPMQEKFLPLLKAAYKNGKAKGSQYAMLIDIIAKHKNKPQMYGSQIDYSSGSPKVYQLYKPLEVDARRKKVGMGPLANYVKNWGLIWPEK